MMTLNVNFKFHAVGFGLFSFGKIGNFSFVYDCGQRHSNRRVNKCIESEFNNDSQLDLLVISHFHQDHINGIEKLLKVVKSVETIILPYITPKERLMYLLSYWNENGKPPSKWVESFMVNPTSALLKGKSKDKIKNIVYINGKQKNLPDNINEKNPEQVIPENENFIFDINDLPISDEAESIKNNESITDSKISIREHGLVYLKTGNTLIPIWQFIFYNIKPSKIVVNYINTIIKKFNIKKGNVDKTTLESIVSSGALSSINKKVKITNDEINNTSLLLYHSYLLNSRAKLYECSFSFHYQKYIIDCYCHLFKRHRIINNNNCCCCSHFFTGDVNLNTKYKEISKYYKSILDKIQVFQVPHHGSIVNWNSNISKANKGMLHIISSEYSNKHALHPNEKVLYEIIKNNGNIVWCNEHNEFELNGWIYYH